MSQDQQSSLRFSVEESVWFQKGQEVGELLSISLDPDITIQEFDQYISIRGALKLTGEYKIDEDYSEEEFEYANLRFISNVETREDGISQLVHGFPVDITIPRNRIGNLEEVYVTIESFDYDLSESRNLRLVADLEISGIASGDAAVEAEEAEEEQELEQAYVFEQEQEPELQPLFRSPQALYEEETQVEEYDAFANAGSQNHADLYEPFHVEVKKEAAEEEAAAPDISYFASRPQYEETYKAPQKQSPKARKEEEARKQDEPKHTENSLYLTKLFERDEEEEFTKLKICLVQQGDTIDSICDRYRITVQQLHRVNQLNSSADVHEGQTLYIPVYANTH
ncbi:stage VI sporulation protein D [Bacillus sp. FSL H8-0547]